MAFYPHDERAHANSTGGREILSKTLSYSPFSGAPSTLVLDSRPPLYVVPRMCFINKLLACPSGRLR